MRFLNLSLKDFRLDTNCGDLESRQYQQLMNEFKWKEHHNWVQKPIEAFMLSLGSDGIPSKSFHEGYIRWQKNAGREHAKLSTVLSRFGWGLTSSSQRDDGLSPRDASQRMRLHVALHR